MIHSVRANLLLLKSWRNVPLHVAVWWFFVLKRYKAVMKTMLLQHSFWELLRSCSLGRGPQFGSIKFFSILTPVTYHLLVICVDMMINKAWLVTIWVFSDQCKEIEANNRMGKTRDLFKKIRDTKGIFSWKDGHNKVPKWYGPNKSRRY